LIDGKIKLNDAQLKTIARILEEGPGGFERGMTANEIWD